METKGKPLKHFKARILAHIPMTGAIIHLKIKDILPMVMQTANRNTPSESKLQNIKPQCGTLFLAIDIVIARV